MRKAGGREGKYEKEVREGGREERRERGTRDKEEG